MPDERSGEYVEPRDEPTTRMLRQMVVQNHESSESGHRRLRGSIGELDLRLAALELLARQQELTLTEVRETLKRPVEATAIRYDMKTVLVLMSICAAVVGGQKWATAGFQEQMTKQATRIDVIDAKMDAIKQHDLDLQKLQDERARGVQMDLVRIANQAATIDTKLNNIMIGRR
ncbi:MAG: hypothetical protein V4597_08640 [Pseudomonadota bacterium]